MNKIFKAAFTLIELLVVIAIIGILSGLIVVSMSGVTSKANVAKAQVFSNSLRNSLMSNIQAQYTFDDITDYNVTTKILNSTAGNVPDSWSSNEGRAYGGPTLKENSDCVLGKCLSFDGANDYIDCGGGSSLSFTTNDFTLGAWIKNSTTAVDLAIISKGSINAAYNQGRYGIRILNGYLNFFVSKNELSSPSANISDSTISLKDGNWHYVVGTRDANIIKIYIDGVYKNQADTTTTYDITNNLNTIIGSVYSTTDSVYTSYFNGSIDDVRIYNEAISASQIKEQYYAGLNSLLATGKIDNNDYASRINAIAYEH